MLGLDPPVAGFTTFDAEGHGMSFDTATVGERVRGRVKRTVMMMVVPKSEAERLVALVRREIAVPHMAYWIEPVLACGRLIGQAPVAAESGGAAAVHTQGVAP